MENKPKSIADQFKEPDRAGRVIRGIAELERDYQFVSEELSERMMFEAVQAIKRAVVDPWRVVETDWSAQILPPEWKMLRGVGVGDAWLELAEICADEEREYCWISAATGTGPTRMGLELAFRPGLQETAQAVIRDDKQMAAIWKAGFVRDETDARLFMPINISLDLLAKGFEENDLEPALVPVVTAVETVLAARAELDKIVEQIRNAKVK